MKFLNDRVLGPTFEDTHTFPLITHTLFTGSFFLIRLPQAHRLFLSACRSLPQVQNTFSRPNFRLRPLEIELITAIGRFPRIPLLLWKANLSHSFSSDWECPVIRHTDFLNLLPRQAYSPSSFLTSNQSQSEYLRLSFFSLLHFRKSLCSLTFAMFIQTKISTALVSSSQSQSNCKVQATQFWIQIPCLYTLTSCSLSSYKFHLLWTNLRYDSFSLVS